MRQDLVVDIPLEDAWLRDLFKLAATLLKEVYQGEEANQVLPWLLFSAGMAYEKGQYELH